MPTIARCSVSLAPLRVMPDHTSEQYSQLLLGDWVICGSTEGSWVHVESVWNADAGWVLHGQLEECVMPLPPIRGLNAVKEASLCGLFQTSAADTPITTAWQLHYEAASKLNGGLRLPLLVNTNAPLLPLSEHVFQFAEAFQGAPYNWGGMSYWGIDCSGLVQLVYRYRGIPLPHAASKQVGYGRVLDFIQEVRPGDVAFFNNEEGQVVHVGIMLSPDRILHASARSGRVQTDAIDWQGILNASGDRTHSLRIITRLEED